MKEIWKDICFEDNGILYDYTGQYQVSNLGRIKAKQRTSLFYNNFTKRNITRKVKEHILNNIKMKKGYERVILHKNGTSKAFFVHRLVAFAFLKNPNNYPIINHIDGNPSNNFVNNLEWCNNSQNQKHAYKMGRQKPKLGSKNSLSKKVLQFDKNMNFIKEYSYLQECQKDGFDWQSVGRVCRKERKSYKKYIWRYKNEF